MAATNRIPKLRTIRTEEKTLILTESKWEHLNQSCCQHMNCDEPPKHSVQTIFSKIKILLDDSLQWGDIITLKYKKEFTCLLTMKPKPRSWKYKQNRINLKNNISSIYKVRNRKTFSSKCNGPHLKLLFQFDRGGAKLWLLVHWLHSTMPQKVQKIEPTKYPDNLGRSKSSMANQKRLILKMCPKNLKMDDYKSEKYSTKFSETEMQMLPKVQKQKDEQVVKSIQQ